MDQFRRRLGLRRPVKFWFVGHILGVLIFVMHELHGGKGLWVLGVASYQVEIRHNRLTRSIEELPVTSLICVLGIEHVNTFLFGAGLGLFIACNAGRSRFVIVSRDSFVFLVKFNEELFTGLVEPRPSFAEDLGATLDHLLGLLVAFVEG